MLYRSPIVPSKCQIYLVMPDKIFVYGKSCNRFESLNSPTVHTHGSRQSATRQFTDTYFVDSSPTPILKTVHIWQHLFELCTLKDDTFEKLMKIKSNHHSKSVDNLKIAKSN